MTHEYTILVGGVIVLGGGEPRATAIAWAGDTVLAIGSDAEALAISSWAAAIRVIGPVPRRREAL